MCQSQKLKESFTGLLLIWFLWFWKIGLIIFHVAKATPASPKVEAFCGSHLSLFILVDHPSVPHLIRVKTHSSSLTVSAPHAPLTTCHWPDTHVPVWSWLHLLPSSSLLPPSALTHPVPNSNLLMSLSVSTLLTHTTHSKTTGWLFISVSTYSSFLPSPTKNPLGS